MREQTPPARRRWFRFSLRTLLVLVMCMSIFCGYLGWALQWKRQRHTYLSSNQFDSWLTLQCAAAFEEQPAPWSLRIINEQGVSCLCFESSDQ